MKKIYFLLSALALSASVNAQTVANGGMETWRVGSAGSTNPKIVRAPNSWYGADSLIIGVGQVFGTILGISDTVWQQQLFKDSMANAHGGTYSAMLVTKDQDTLGIFPGLLSNAETHVDLSTFDISFTGGQASNLRTTTVSAWVKYAPASPTDSASLTVQAYGSIDGVMDSLIGFATIKIGATPAFTQVTANLIYPDPSLYMDTVRITFASSSDTAGAVGSTLWVDDVTMTGVAQVDNVPAIARKKINVYPNPANGTLYMEGAQVATVCNLIAVNGQVVATKSFSGKSSIDISTLPAGLYFYTLSENGNITQRGKVSVTK